MVERVVDEAMRAYYDRRAAEYDDWWLGTGLFARRERPGWDAEVAAVLAAVSGLGARRWLDVACGTGFVTRHLRGDVTGLDQSAAMVEIAAARLPGGRAVQGDAVPLPFADDAFDAVFTANFYGHLLADERSAFLAEARRVAPALVILDAALQPGGTGEEWQERKLDDGSRHRVYKRWFRAGALAAELGGHEVLHEGDWFVVVRA
jgi:demethylmenaquinone methyltransferase/2-methoxy-6-polyprenyl-1,4-benzoquinol methylase